jgi:4-hydroxy-tetrahydrodipicolinate synthase
MGIKITGIIGAPVTPFKGADVDYETFVQQVNFLIDNGVDALAHPMHIGESLNLRDEERRELARVLVQAAANRVPTFVNVSFAATDMSVDLARHSAKVDSTGIVLLAPYYWEPAPKDIIEHFVAAASAHGGQLIAYNNLHATNVSLTVDICRTLLERIPGFVGLKDASFDMPTFTAYCAVADQAPHPLAVYTGVEHLLPSIAVGGSGCFSACTEVAPRMVRALYEACVAGELATARELQQKMLRLLNRLMRAYPATIKYAMELMDRPVGETRRPIPALTADEKKATRDDLDALGIFESEPHGWALAARAQVALRRRAVHAR